MKLALARNAWKTVAKRFGYGALRPFEWVIDRTSDTGPGKLFDAARFPWARELERNWWIIRQELDGVLQQREMLPDVHTILEETARISRDSLWKTYYFYNYGTKFPRSCALCPETTRLVEAIPGMTTAFFSILSPRKHIPRHRGPYKGVLRAHLALIVPQPSELCGIHIDDLTAHWEEGKVLIFDDTYQHDVFNDTNGIRVVLFLDVIRPLPAPLSTLNLSIMRTISGSIFMRDLNRNQLKWEDGHLAELSASLQARRSAGPG